MVAGTSQVYSVVPGDWGLIRYARDAATLALNTQPAERFSALCDGE